MGQSDFVTAEITNAVFKMNAFTSQTPPSYINWADSFDGEDLNNNGVLDADEDVNKDGELNKGYMIKMGGSALFIDYRQAVLEMAGNAEFRIDNAVTIRSAFSIKLEISTNLADSGIELFIDGKILVGPDGSPILELDTIGFLVAKKR